MIAGVISFCTHDARFLDRCIEGLSPICDQILIPVCDHFFDGTPENYQLLEQLFVNHPQVTFVEFAYSTSELYGSAAKLIPGNPGTAQYWHCSSRFIATYFLKEEITHLLFCDTDEIADSAQLAKYIENEVQAHTALRFAAYYYYRSPIWRAEEISEYPLLVKRKELTHAMLTQEDERFGIFQMMPEPKRAFVGIDAPAFHHYSWVHPKEEALAKAKRWGHHWERNWEELINHHFEGPLQRQDFIRKYHYKEAPLFFDPLAVSIPSYKEARAIEAHRKKVKEFAHVICTNPKEIWRKEIESLSKKAFSR